MGPMEEECNGIRGTGQHTQAAQRHSVEHLYVLPGSTPVYVQHLFLLRAVKREVVELVLAWVRS